MYSLLRYGRDRVGKVREYVSHRDRSPIPEIFYGTRESLCLSSSVGHYVLYVKENSNIDYVKDQKNVRTYPSMEKVVG